MPPVRATCIVRTAGVLVVGALGVHQLSYLLLHGAETGSALARGGHGYLLTIAPGLAAAAVALVLTTVAVAALTPNRGARRARGLSFEARAAILAVAFLAVFATQELIEGALLSGHPQGFAALAETWIALPLAFPIAALTALALGGLERAERLIVRARARVLTPLPLLPSQAPPTCPDPRLTLAGLPLAFGLVRRGPPDRAF